jgi:hypothetical protein
MIGKYTFHICVLSLASLALFWGGSLPAEEPLVFNDRITHVVKPNDIIKEFRVKDCPFNQCYGGLTSLGIRLCIESAPGLRESPDVWIDKDGYYAYSGKGYTLYASDVSRETLLDEFVKVLPDYKWEAVSNSNLVNLTPKSNSELDQVVGPYKGRASLDAITNSVEGMVKIGIIRGRLPVVSVDFPGGTRREFLNVLAAAAGDSWVWRVGRFNGFLNLSFSMTSVEADRVRLEYDVRRGVPVDLSADLLDSHYEGRQARMGDEFVLAPRRIVRDQAIYISRIQNSQHQEISGECYMAIRALLAHDVEKFLEFCHPDGVRDDDRLMPDEVLRGMITKFVEAHAQDTDRLADLIDPKSLTVQVQGEQLQYVIPVKAERQSNYGKQFSFTLEKCADKRWRIVKLAL